MRLKDKAWVYVSLLTLATAMIWFAVTLRSTLNRSTIPSNIDQITKPLDPSLDFSVIDKLKQRSL